MQELRTIGIVAAPHGLQGTVRVNPLSDFPARFLNLSECYWRRPGSPPVEIRVRQAKITGRSVLITFDSIRTRDEAESLRGAELCVRNSDSWPLPENTFYISDIIGFRAVAEDGIDLGTLTSVIRGAQDVLQIEGPRGELLVPFVKEWVGNVDLTSMTIVVLSWQQLE